MHFGFILEFSDIDLWNKDLLDKHLDLQDTDILGKCFVCLHNVFKTSSTYVFKTPSRHVLNTSSRHVFKTSSRHLQRNSFSSSKTFSRRLEDVFKMSWKTYNCYAEDVLKTSLRPTNVCWEQCDWSYRHQNYHSMQFRQFPSIS